jgi:hypothetical protein
VLVQDQELEALLIFFVVCVSRYVLSTEELTMWTQDPQDVTNRLMAWGTCPPGEAGVPGLEKAIAKARRTTASRGTKGAKHRNWWGQQSEEDKKRILDQQWQDWVDWQESEKKAKKKKKAEEEEEEDKEDGHDPKDPTDKDDKDDKDPDDKNKKGDGEAPAIIPPGMAVLAS